MATVKRAYTSEYSYAFVPEVQPERVRRTRQRPERNTNQEVNPSKRSGGLTPEVLRALIMAVLAIGILLIGIVVVNATAAKLQYSINQLRSENSVIQTEIDMLNIKADSKTGISQLETQAKEDLQMYYPQGSECVRLSSLSESDGSLSDIIKEKAYQ